MTAAPLRTAVFCHDAWHPASVVRNGLGPLAGDRFSFDWLDTPAAWASASLPAYEFIVLAKGNTTAPGDARPWLTPALEQSFVEHVHQGKGILFLHAGTCYRDHARLRALTGGAFLQHPPVCTVTLEPHPRHPVSDGLTTATLTDEHYEMILDDPSAEVFLHSRSEHGSQPAGWTRSENGRVCVLTPGHDERAWENAAFTELLRRSLLWASGNDF